MYWRDGLKQELDRIEAQINDLAAQGIPNDDPRWQQIRDEMDHFDRLAYQMEADDKALDGRLS